MCVCVCVCVCVCPPVLCVCTRIPEQTRMQYSRSVHTCMRHYSTPATRLSRVLRLQCSVRTVAVGIEGLVVKVGETFYALLGAHERSVALVHERVKPEVVGEVR